MIVKTELHNSFVQTAVLYPLFSVDHKCSHCINTKCEEPAAWNGYKSIYITWESWSGGGQIKRPAYSAFQFFLPPQTPKLGNLKNK
jgi:hypothetical protein